MSNRLCLSALCASSLLLFLSSATAQTVVSPPVSTAFSTFSEERYSTLQISAGNGDLWPSCWADDGNLYTANGDGNGFSDTFYAMAINKIAGTPATGLTGTWVAGDVGHVYITGDHHKYTDKPTGMLCIDNTIYLAFQNINETTFNDVPAAAIIKSTDHGATWSAAPDAPMFGTRHPYGSDPTPSPKSYLFTTIFFLDYGKNGSDTPLNDGYVYAYGMNNSWSNQQELYLARVPHLSVLDRSAWKFYSGTKDGSPTWVSDITKEAPVIADHSLRYPVMYPDSASHCPATEPINPQGTTVNGQTVIGQGGVTYDKPLNRYIFSSWSCVSHEFYEAENPWGPWSHIEEGRTSLTSTPTATTDFGTIALPTNRGQYGTSIPSKFISANGESMYLQSNLCCGGDSYTFALRKLHLKPFVETKAHNEPSGTNLATLPGAKAISKSTHFGSLCAAECADQLAGTGGTPSEDDFDDENKATDWWGYTWPHEHFFNRVVYTTGGIYTDGGWYAGDLVVQVRNNFEWKTISNAVFTPTYPYSSAAGAQTAYTISLPLTSGDGIRIFGTPGGAKTFTSIAHLGVYYLTPGTNLVADPGFEFQKTSTISGPWAVEGPDAHGIDLGAGFAHSGANDAWINDASTVWDAITQTIAVQQNTNYTLTGWLRNNFTSNVGYFGVRKADGISVLQETSFGSLPGYTQLTVSFNSGSNATVKVYAGFFGQGVPRFIQLDDVAIQ